MSLPFPHLSHLRKAHKRSYFVVNKYKVLLNAAIWFDKAVFLDYKNNL